MAGEWFVEVDNVEKGLENACGGSEICSVARKQIRMDINRSKHIVTLGNSWI
jgi:hypothetical protein